MNIILDTSYVYDLVDSPGKLEELDRRALASPQAKFSASVASLWELNLKFRSFGRFGNRIPPFSHEQVIEILASLDIALLSISPIHTSQLLDPPLRYQDPFDELLLNQAQAEDSWLLTRDANLLDHPLTIDAERLASFRSLRESIRD